MTAAITAILSLIEQLLPAILSSTNATLVTNIIVVLTNMLPYIIQEVEALYTPVKNIIAALSANPATTAEQLASLQALDAQMDSAFEAIAAQTDADTAAAATATPTTGTAST
jgi:hypothetical protein